MKKNKIIILSAPYYEQIVGELLRGVEQAAIDYPNVTLSEDIISVAGALELPLALSFITQRFVDDIKRGELGVVALGCVLRGETEHFSLICNEVFGGLQRVAIRHSLPLGVGVLACDNADQAFKRASYDGSNDAGGHALRACYGLLSLRQKCLIDE